MNPLNGDSSDPAIPGVQGVQTGDDGTGVLGIGQGNGVLGQSMGNNGFAGVRGESDGGPGVSGESAGSVGVDAKTQSGPAAVRAISAGNGPGVFGTGLRVGVLGTSTGSEGFSGVRGESNGGPGVSGESVGSVGVDAKTQTGPAALRAVSAGNGPGVFGTGLRLGVLGTSTGSEGFSGVHGESNGGPGVSGESVGSVGVDAKTQSGPAALRAVHAGGGVAGLFGGDVRVTRNLIVEGDIQLPNADCAEDFDIVGPVQVDPGTVMVLGAEGALVASFRAYDRRVAGVISGAGHFRPGLVLDKRLAPSGNRQPVALMGKVFCKVDAAFGAVEIGDLLTSSPTPGHAMKTDDPAQAFGAVIGKALRPLPAGQALIPILVALQ